MSLTWNRETRVEQPSVSSRPNWKERAASAALIFAALYFLSHIIAAFARGSFGGWR